MALSYTFYKNDGTSVSEQLPFMPATPFPDPAADFGWPVQGKTFKGWNTESDGSGTFYYTGDTIWESAGRTFYAIWEAPVTMYLTTDRDLTSIANAIRTKGGTSSPLEFPNGFVDAIDAIQTGGGGGQYEVTINLTNPISPSAFQSCTIYEAVNFIKGNQIGSISSATGSATVTLQSPCNSIIMELDGGYLNWNFSGYNTWMSGGIGINAAQVDGSSGTIYLCIIGDGTIEISAIEWDD